MSMAVDQKPQSHFGSMSYDPMRYPQQPQFSNPWAPSTASSPPSHHPLYASSLQASQSLEQSSSRPQNMSMGYTANPAASSIGSELVPTRTYGSSYGSSAPQSQSTYAPSVPQYSSPEQSQSNYGYDSTRRPSYPQHTSPVTFSDEMASARGMVAMASSQDMTPRNVYGSSNPRTGSQDGYGFPTTHSTHSSVSSASTYPYYNGSYNGSVDGSSVTDYSSASEDAMGSRTLPAPNQLINGFPPEPASMMNQFNSKSSPNAQKKHKCKICDKRFTRPSSLQTHMYSHTGEKPFACDHEGCGRNFSVVSNLRRHKKVHKEDHDATMDDEE